MAVEFLDPRVYGRTGLQEFTEGASPYLQMAFQAMLKRKFEEQQRQRNLERLRELMPETFTETTPVSEYQKLLPRGKELRLTGGLTPERQTQVARQLIQAKGIKIPERIRKFALKTKDLQPSIDITTGQATLKPEDAFQTYYRSLIAGQGAKPQTGASFVPMTPEEAINNFIAQNPDVKREDVRVTPKPLSGTKGMAYYEASVSPESEAVKKKEAEQQRETKKSVGEFKGFVEQFERSYDELTTKLPSIGATGIGGYGVRMFAKLGEKTGYFPETSAFLRELKPKANQMARTIEGGRVTDEDRKIYAESFANVLEVPSETNIRLVANSLINAQRKGGDISIIMGALQDSDNEIMQGIVGEVRKVTPVSQPQQPTQQPQIDLRQQAIEELRRRGKL